MTSTEDRSLPSNGGAGTQPTEISRALVEQIHPMQDPPVSSTPVEMTKFDQSSTPDAVPSQPRTSLPPTQATATSDTPVEGQEPILINPASRPTTSLPATGSPANASTDLLESSMPTPISNPTRQKTVPTNGSSAETPIPLQQESDIIGPILLVTLLLTNGARHPYKIDEKYLKKRSVHVEDNNPVNMSTYTLKELIWRDWREEWEARPSSPSSIRLIYYGKLLDDKMRLHESKFSLGSTAHVVHMTVKPQDVVDEEDAKIKTGGKDREGSERTHGCRCVIL